MMSYKHVCRSLLLLVMSLLLSACDGGLFGTGDGQDVLAVGTEASNIDGGVSNIADEVNSSPMTDQESSSTVAFENLQVGTTTTHPLINVINVSNRAVVATLESDGQALFDSPITAGSFTHAVQLVLGENHLTLSDPDTFNELYALNPLSVGASTLTTLIVRNQTIQGIDVVTMSSMAMSITPSMAQLRIVQANLLSEEDTGATFTLQPSGDLPGESEVSFPDISLATAGLAMYQTVSSGDYVLVDSQERISQQTLSLQAGKIYTLIVLGEPDSTILVHEDSLLNP